MDASCGNGRGVGFAVLFRPFVAGIFLREAKIFEGTVRGPFPPPKSSLCVPCGVAADVHRHGQAGDVRRREKHVHAKAVARPPVPAGPMPRRLILLSRSCSKAA